MSATSQRRRSRLAALLLGTVALVFLGLPQILLLLPNPEPTRVADVLSAGRGTYAIDGEVAWRLFPRANTLDSAPDDAPMVSADVRLVSVARAREDVSGYRLRDLAGSEVKAEVKLLGGRAEIAPSALAPGPYELAVPRDSMFGGTDYFYFVVR